MNLEGGFLGEGFPTDFALVALGMNVLEVDIEICLEDKSFWTLGTWDDGPFDIVGPLMLLEGFLALERPVTNLMSGKKCLIL